MAIVIGVPGNSAKIKVFVDRYMGPALYAAVLMLVSPVAAWQFTKSVAGGALGLMVTTVGLAIFAWRDPELRQMLRDFKGAKSWKQGAEGEDRSGEALAKLPDTFVVFHDYHPQDAQGERLPWNVDHVVIGPTGVFVVETKNYTRKHVGPSSKDPVTRKNVKQAAGNAYELKQHLKAWSAGALDKQFVQPLLVYAQDGAYVKQPFEGAVKVIPLKWLQNDLTARTGNELDPDTIYRIARVLFSKLPWEFRDDYQSELDRYGARSREFKLVRAEERRNARLAAERPIEPRPSEPDSHVLPMCPKCGSPLVRRIASRGARQGKPFLGCSAFATTHCNYILNVEE